MQTTFFHKGKHPHIFDSVAWEEFSLTPPNISSAYLILSKSLSAKYGIGTHTVIYAGRATNILDRMYRHQKANKFPRGPSDLLISQNWSNYRDNTLEYEEFLKYLFSPIYDKEHAHIRANRGGRIAVRDPFDINWDGDEITYAHPENGVVI